MEILEKDNWRIGIIPENGSCIHICQYSGTNIFRPTDLTGQEKLFPFQTAHFPLLPVSNRIENGAFTFDGVDIHLAPNAPDQKHPLHGLGWLADWYVLDKEKDSITLAFHHSLGEWPWKFTAKQTISINQTCLNIRLEITNLDQRRMPAGLGFHPYFDQPGSALLSFQARGAWLPGEDNLPREWIAVSDHLDFSNGQSLVGRDLDHCFTGWAGEAQIKWANKPFGLKISGDALLKHCALYISQKEKCFCFEPISHVHNALASTTPQSLGIEVLEPGQSLNSTCIFEII